MTFTRADLKRLRWPIGAALLLAAVGFSCFIASEHYLAQAKTARESTKGQREQAQKRVEQVAEEEREIRRNLVSYNKMVQRGMASQENRLDLIDAIAKIKNDRRLFEIRYSIDPQKALDYPGVSPSGPLDFVTSRMKLDMLLLHEEDLLDFLDDLTASGKAYVAVRNCSVSRLDRGPTAAASVVPRLRSECQVDLIALRQVKGTTP
jgi:hypothetical protein